MARQPCEMPRFSSSRQTLAGFLESVMIRDTSTLNVPSSAKRRTRDLRFRELLSLQGKSLRPAQDRKLELPVQSGQKVGSTSTTAMQHLRLFAQTQNAKVGKACRGES